MRETDDETFRLLASFRSINTGERVCVTFRGPQEIHTPKWSEAEGPKLRDEGLDQLLLLLSMYLHSICID